MRFWSLVTAEFQRASQTRSTLTLVTIVIGIAFMMLIIRTILAQRSGTPLEPQAVTLSADLVGFAVLLAAAIAVARDYQTGTIDLLRTLTPARPRHLLARTVGMGLLALIAVGLVVLAGLTAVLLLGDGTVSWQLAEQSLEPQSRHSCSPAREPASELQHGQLPQRPSPSSPCTG